ncbi:8-amino-7-oxononanoate synthase [Sphingomonas sp. CJ99]
MRASETLSTDLAGLAAVNRHRALAPRSGFDFSSNDYLALARSPRLAKAAQAALERGVAAGSGGSRLLRGNDPEHEALEAEAAAFFEAESSLFFSSGFAANATILSTLPQRGDLILHDALVHASAHEGMRLARADVRSVTHNSVQAFADAIADWRRSGGMGTPWIVVESLYSMDGDRAPLEALAALAEAHDAVLVVDEAHATGVFGDHGQGLSQPSPRRISVHTCGKAMGVEGALVCLPTVMRDFIVNRGRAFIYSTAPSPLIAAMVRESLRILADEPDRRAGLHTLIAEANRVLAPLGIEATGSQIIPVILGDDGRVMQVAALLQAAGFDVRGIRPPTIPMGTARLRLSLTLNISAGDLGGLAAALQDAMA